MASKARITRFSTKIHPVLAYYNKYYQNAMAGAGITIEDLRPVPGSPGETVGAFRRIFELLGSPSLGSQTQANDDSFVVETNSNRNHLDVLRNDASRTGGSLTILSVEAESAGGTISIGDGRHVEYIPAVGFRGESTFSYVVRDSSSGEEDTALASVTVPRPASSPPFPGAGA